MPIGINLNQHWGFAAHPPGTILLPRPSLPAPLSLVTRLILAGCGLAQAAPPHVPIPAIQGAGEVSPHVGDTLLTGGVVTAVFPGLRGFFLQDPGGDGNPATSDGIFVYLNDTPLPAGLSVGRYITLKATVTEFNGLTELTNPGSITLREGGPLPVPVDIRLPLQAGDTLERYEGMLVRIVSPMTVVQNTLLGRYGQLTLSAGGRLETPTNRHPPGSAAARALAEANRRHLLVLDDGASVQNPAPPPYLDPQGRVRAGDTLGAPLVGVLDQGPVGTGSPAVAGYRLHPTEAPQLRHSSPRPARPAAVGGTHRVAAFNVHNYFNGDGLGGGFPTPRGAASPDAFARQRGKIIAALKAIDADVVGLVEIENDPADTGTSALQDLVNALNAELGAGTYATVPDPADGTGTDEIRVALIYKPGRLTLAGAALSDPAPVNTRAPLAQAFATREGERFSVIVNHFKSKHCAGATGADRDQGDGQACYAARRSAQARQLKVFADRVAAASGSKRILLIGDLNAYGQEDPVRLLTAGGFVDLLARRQPPSYSYLFDGEAGYLDHALASTALAPRVRGVAHWHINADEPPYLDYRREPGQPACTGCPSGTEVVTPTPYRASDHDPVLLGLDLARRPARQRP